MYLYIFSSVYIKSRERCYCISGALDIYFECMCGTAVTWPENFGVKDFSNSSCSSYSGAAKAHLSCQPGIAGERT